MTPEVITSRRPLWVAMSDLFLDTDVRLSYCYIARTLASAPFTIEQLGVIFHKEVSPIAAPNLMVVAGEWAGFDEEWLVSRISARLDGASRMPSFGSVARDDWDSVVVLITRLRKLAEADRPRRLALWDQLSRFFLDRVPTSPLATRPDGWSNAELDAVWREEMWPSFGRSVELYRKHNSAAYPSKDEIERAWTQWKNAVS